MPPINSTFPSQCSTTLQHHFYPNLSHHRARSRTLVSPGRRQNTYRFVVSRKAVDAGFDEDETEFRVLVFAVALEMLADGDGLTFVSARSPLLNRGIKREWDNGGQRYLLDQHVQVLWDLWCKACHEEITPSVIDQAEAMSCEIAAGTSS